MKIFVVAGNHAEFIDYRKRKYAEMQTAGIAIKLTDIINVSSPEAIRGYHDPHGVFIGTWKMRKDIGEVINILQMCQTNAFSNKSLTALREEWDKFQFSKPTPKKRPTAEDVINQAAALLAKEIDKEVLNIVMKESKQWTMLPLKPMKP